MHPCAPAIIRIAAAGRKGYDAFNDAPSTSPVRLYVRRIIAPPPPKRSPRRTLRPFTAKNVSFMNQQQLSEQLPAIIDELVGGLGGEPGLQHLNRVYLPSKDVIIEAI